MGMSKIAFWGLLLTSPLLLSAQTIRLTDAQKQAIAGALSRIQMADVAVESIIYNGMTFDEIQSIFPKTQLSINYDPLSDYTKQYGDKWSNECYFGNYIIFFSDMWTHNNPVIIGYAKQGDVKIYVKKM